MLFVEVETIQQYEGFVKCQKENDEWVHVAPETNKHADFKCQQSANNVQTMITVFIWSYCLSKWVTEERK